MEAFVALLAAAALVAAFVLLLWAIARGSRRLLGYGAVMDHAVRRCASCAERPVCETGALAGWLGTGPRACPNLERLQERKPL